MSPEYQSLTDTIDTLGQTCPGPVLSATQRIRGLDAGAVIDIVSDCEGAGDDLQAWAHATGNHLLETRSIDAHARAYRLLKGHKADATLDLRGQRCPVPVIEAARAVGRLQTDQVLRLISDCPRAPEEVTSWVEATGHVLLNEVADQNGDHSYYIRKTFQAH